MCFPIFNDLSLWSIKAVAANVRCIKQTLNCSNCKMGKKGQGKSIRIALPTVNCQQNHCNLPTSHPA